MPDKIPVTVLTGFLGSGKTTLLNRILTENHGARIAVIENEFGEIGVDQDLVINADEEIFEMNNGCICCTVCGDLIRILGNLAKRRDRFDRIVLETTGLADPGPVAQTFFVDDEVRDRFFIDGIVTLVDAKHIEQHLDEGEEAVAQIAFADLLVLNKIDLVSATDVSRLQSRLKGINGLARVLPAYMAEAPINELLNIGGFDLERALQTNPQFLEPEYPFEWAGVFELPAGTSILHFEANPDPVHTIVIAPIAEASERALRELAEKVFPLFSEPGLQVSAGQSLELAPQLCVLDTLQPCRQFSLHLDRGGLYAMFTEHTFKEFQGYWQHGGAAPLLLQAECDFNPGHEHDDTVQSVSLVCEGDLDDAKLNRWLGVLLQTRGTDIFRMKGILAIQDADSRIVLQGVHMLMDAVPGSPWGAAAHNSRLVFIGRNLDSMALQAGFEACRVA